MKTFISPTYTFTPGLSGVGTVDLSGIASFNKKSLIAIINQTKGIIIYSTASTTLRYTSVVGTLVTLFFDTSTMSAGDTLQVIYEDITTPQVMSNSSYSGTITSIQKTVGLTEVRATVSGVAPTNIRKKLFIKPSKNNTGSIYLIPTGGTISSGCEIIGPDRLEFLFDYSDYYLISDTAGQVVDILEVN